MGYLAKRSQQRARAKRGKGGQAALGLDFGDLIDWVQPGFSYSYQYGAALANKQCANNATLTAKPIADNIERVSKEWNPSGFYERNDIASIVGNVEIQLRTWQSNLANTPPTSGDGAQMIKEAQDQVERYLGTRPNARGSVISWRDQVNKATQSFASVMDAPTFKDWVLHALLTCAFAAETVSIQQCHDSALEKAKRAIEALLALLAKIGNAILDVGAAIYKVPKTIGDYFGFIKWAVVLGGGFYAYTQWVKPRLKK